MTARIGQYFDTTQKYVVEMANTALALKVAAFIKDHRYALFFAGCTVFAIATAPEAVCFVCLKEAVAAGVVFGAVKKLWYLNDPQGEKLKAINEKIYFLSGTIILGMSYLGLEGFTVETAAFCVGARIPDFLYDQLFSS